MGRVNNTIDKFGRQKVNTEVQLLRGSPGVGFKHTSDGQYDIEGKSLRNVAKPVNDDDAATRRYVLEEISNVRLQIYKIINEDFLSKFNLIQNEFEAKIISMIATNMSEFDQRIVKIENSEKKNIGKGNKRKN